MLRSRRTVVVALLVSLAGLVGLTSAVRAQVPPGPATSTSAAPSASTSSPPPLDPTTVEQAKRYFEEGEALRSAKQFQAALEAYIRSHALVPRASNTNNIGLCLYELKRLDEAYEFFDEALTKYPESQLDKATRDGAKKAMADIEEHVGRLDVSANVDAKLVIDGRMRGKLPLVAPVRVMPGKHVVRVLRDGFAIFEQTVEVSEKATVTVDAKLAALTTAGRLRVEASKDLDGGTVFVDGGSVGTIPWEGTLAPGTHVIVVTKDDLGTGPQLANVIVGQTVKLAAEGKALGPDRRILVDPTTADLSIDGVVVGKGHFQGRLPIGAHVIEARELGYFSARTTMDVNAKDASDYWVNLKIDASHPRWGSKEAGRFALELGGGFGFVPGSFAPDATGLCSRALTCSKSSAHGPRFALTGVFELSSKIQFLVQGGYLSYARSVDRSLSKYQGKIPAVFSFHDDVNVRGPFAAAGLGYRLPISGLFDLQLRLWINGAFVTARDTVAGSVTGPGATAGSTRTVPSQTAGSGASSGGVMFAAIPEVSAGAWVARDIRVTLGVAFPITLLNGPAFKLGGSSAVKSLPCDPNNPSPPVDCVQQQAFDPSTAAYGRSFAVLPQASVGYWF